MTFPNDPNPASRQPPDQGKHALPLSASELLLLDLVEGAGTPDQIARLAPESRALLEALRRDRQVLAGIPDQSAPTGMCDAIVARLEREALFEDPFGAEKLSTGVLLTADQFERRLELQGQFDSRSHELDRDALIGAIGKARSSDPQRTRGLIAAGLLLIVGGGLYFASLAMKPSGENGNLAAGPTVPQPMPEKKLAINDPKVNIPDGSSEAAPGATVPALTDSAAVHVAGTSPQRAPESPMGFGSSVQVAMAAADRSRVIDGGDAGPRAVKAAREGRLVIRITTADPETAKTRLAGIAGEKQPETRSWRLAQATQPDVIAAATAGVPTFEERLATQREQLERARMMAQAFNDSPGSPTTAFLKVDAPATRFDPRTDQGVYLLDVAATEKAISAARLVLAGTAPTPGSDRIELVELESPVPSLPSTQVEAVMWWTQAPKDWISHANVPVVIQAK